MSSTPQTPRGSQTPISQSSSDGSDSPEKVFIQVNPEKFKSLDGFVDIDIDPEKTARYEGVAHIVDWDGPDDPENPMNWPSYRKWLTIGLISFSSFNV